MLLILARYIFFNVIYTVIQLLVLAVFLLKSNGKLSFTSKHFFCPRCFLFLLMSYRYLIRKPVLLAIFCISSRGGMASDTDPNAAGTIKVMPSKLLYLQQ